ncbi:MAG: cobalamin-binding protein [Geminicoccaceae bacterium]|nr:MAG: cobalamin-binding protein [Geminicoccaceae bacterium]
MRRGPWRIVCLTEETTETLYLLGAEERIVGISGYTVRPPEARRTKPKVSAFTSAKIDAIVDLRPDLVLAFSDLQAGIAAELARAGLEVHLFNQRNVEGILTMIRTLGRLVDEAARADRLADGYAQRLAEIGRNVAMPRPRVYLEEWDDPLITGIGWWSELVQIAGGDDVFATRARAAAARDRIVTADAVKAAAPEVMFASWCGKKVRPERIAARPGWSELPAVRDGAIHAVASHLILQPGPAALTDGLDALVEAIRAWQARHRA